MNMSQTQDNSESQPDSGMMSPESISTLGNISSLNLNSQESAKTVKNNRSSTIMKKIPNLSIKTDLINTLEDDKMVFEAP